MHLIELFLEIINLLLKRLLLVELLIILLLLGSRIGGNLGYLYIFIDNLLQHLRTNGKPILLQDMVTLFIVNAKPRGQNTAHLLNRLMAFNHARHDLPCMETSYQIFQLFLNFIQLSSGFFLIQVLHIIKRGRL